MLSSKITYREVNIFGYGWIVYDLVSICIFSPNIFEIEIYKKNAHQISLLRLEKTCHSDSGLELRLDLRNFPIWIRLDIGDLSTAISHRHISFSPKLRTTKIQKHISHCTQIFHVHCVVFLTKFKKSKLIQICYSFFKCDHLQPFIT